MTVSKLPALYAFMIQRRDTIPKSIKNFLVSSMLRNYVTPVQIRYVSKYNLVYADPLGKDISFE